MTLSSPQKIWLYGMCLLILLMVGVGGITRLTHSGLSIVEWKPISGILPPLNQSQWEREFEAYKQFPEYKKVNRGMTLAEFRWIFFWEYIHRLLGRLIGLVFFVPMAYFWLRRQLSRPLKRRLLWIFLLGGLQGLMGWYMVKSGLVHEPRVSHLRLAAHLSLAFLVFAALYWTLLQGSFKRRGPQMSHHSGKLPFSEIPAARKVFPNFPVPGSLQSFPVILLILTGLQIVYGAFVAGLRAGLIYNTFPTMNGMWIPAQFFILDPWTLNFVSNPAVVQFVHRCLAWLILAVMMAYVTAAYFRKDSLHKKWSLLVLTVGGLQFLLGVFTLLLRVPVALGVLHQINALILLAAVLTAAFRPRLE